MATLSAATAASLLVGLMAIAPRPGSGAATPGRTPDHGRHDAPRRTVSTTAIAAPPRPTRS